jgi:hypothetical protein
MTIALSNFRDALGFFEWSCHCHHDCQRRLSPTPSTKVPGENISLGQSESAPTPLLAPDHPIPTPYVIWPDQRSEQAPQHASERELYFASQKS